ncbi:MAG: nitronate monooxygenase, partial [Candidatus Hodarchaeota archaeon]
MKFSQLLEGALPIFAYNPPGVKEPSLAVAVSQSGAVGLIDLEGLDQKNGLSLLKKMATLEKWGVRASNRKHVSILLESQIDIPIIIVAYDIDEFVLAELNKRKGLILAEVVSLREAQAKNWADSFIVKGCEAGGRIGEETAFLLCQQFSKAGLLFALQGGIGLYTAPAAFVGGAEAIVLDGQLYLTDESPLSATTKDFLSKIESTDTVILGETTSSKYRAFGRPGTPCIRKLLSLERKLWNDAPKNRRDILDNERAKLLKGGFGASDLPNTVLPIGQDFSMGKKLIHRFGNTRNILRGLMEFIKESVALANQEFPFLEDSSFAANHGIRFPIVQGPMANVSDTVAFARAIADAGALPFLAFASLNQEQASQAYEQFRAGLQDQSFGCGIIGLEANALAREIHTDLMLEHRPACALVAAGTIEQAQDLTNRGVKTFLHIPSPQLLSQALESGLRHFVLEGMECGGHIGFLTSFVL